MLRHTRRRSPASGLTPHLEGNAHTRVAPVPFDLNLPVSTGDSTLCLAWVLSGTNPALSRDRRTTNSPDPQDGRAVFLGPDFKRAESAESAELYSNLYSNFYSKKAVVEA